jgi:phosphate transport system substrate-binding protein
MLKFTSLIIVIIATIMLGCINQPGVKYIKIKGSDTMRILSARWAEEYMLTHKDISIYTEGGGSLQGIKALINGEIDICNASRPMLPSEVRQLAENHNKLGIAHLVAKDALSVYTNPANPVRSLTIADLKKIFTGKAKNWKEFNGPNMAIHVINRSPNSGTFLYFREHVLNDQPYLSSATIKYSTQEVVNEVVADSAAIGYGGTAYGGEVIHIKINGVAPSIENVNNGQYPIVRYLYLYTTDTPTGHIKEFIDWILDKPGQTVVAKVGFIPLWFEPISVR